MKSRNENNEVNSSKWEWGKYKFFLLYIPPSLHPHPIPIALLDAI
jgi:hypothetical protein